MDTLVNKPAGKIEVQLLKRWIRKNSFRDNAVGIDAGGRIYFIDAYSLDDPALISFKEIYTIIPTVTDGIFRIQPEGYNKPVNITIEEYILRVTDTFRVVIRFGIHQPSKTIVLRSIDRQQLNRNFSTIIWEKSNGSKTH